MFLEKQITIFERFLKDHVRLKTGVMSAENYIWKYTKIQQKKNSSNNKNVYNYNTISQYYCFTVFLIK